MEFYYYLVLLIALSASFAYINQRFIRLPFVIGLFLLATILSLLVLVTRPFVHFQHEPIQDLVRNTDVSRLILDIMLAFLLFAGALHTSWGNLRMRMRPILLLAIGGVLLSTFLIAGMMYYAGNALGMVIPFLHCLLFGALISPTDPIAVLGIFKKAQVPEKLENTIVGESLFNDGIGVVVFLVLVGMVGQTEAGVDEAGIFRLFVQEVGGGLGFGLVAGYLLHVLMRSIDHYQTEILLTLAFVMGGYLLCSRMHFSGPLAMVVMGLLVGNFRKEVTMSDTTIEYVNKFWELVDVILNAILFILIALVIVVIPLRSQSLLLGLTAIFVILLSRILVVGFYRRVFSRAFSMSRAESKVVIWGGLRGGLSIALVLSLPESASKEVLLVSTYVVVVFSILVQGLTIGPFARRVLKQDSKEA